MNINLDIVIPALIVYFIIIVILIIANIIAAINFLVEEGIKDKMYIDSLDKAIANNKHYAERMKFIMELENTNISLRNYYKK
jgi:hypothetical protein